jgi:hypothetical protein
LVFDAAIACTGNPVAALCITKDNVGAVIVVVVVLSDPVLTDEPAAEVDPLSPPPPPQAVSTATSSTLVIDLINDIFTALFIP